jgi:hypothetical protein
MATKTQQNQAVKLVADMLTARRNGNIMREQVAYDKLYAWCQKNGFSFTDAVDFGTRQLKRSVAASMNGII